MVVGDDDADPARLDVLHLLAVGYAAVDGDDEVGRTGVDHRSERRNGQAVAFAPLGDMHRCAHAVPLQRGEQNGRRADAVGIVIAEHGDQAAILLHLADSADEFAHAAHQEGRKEIILRGAEKTLRLFGRIHPARIENFRGQLAQAALLRESADPIELFGGIAVFRRNFFHTDLSFSGSGAVQPVRRAVRPLQNKRRVHPRTFRHGGPAFCKNLSFSWIRREPVFRPPLPPFPASFRKRNCIWISPRGSYPSAP